MAENVGVDRGDAPIAFSGSVGWYPHRIPQEGAEPDGIQVLFFFGDPASPEIRVCSAIKVGTRDREWGPSLHLLQGQTEFSLRTKSGLLRTAGPRDFRMAMQRRQV